MFPVLARSATFTVSKDGRGAYSTVQSAIDKAGKNDIIEIMDQAVYEEQVTIDSLHNGLTIRSSAPDALKKPTIKYKDVTHQNPKTCQDALSPNKIDFDQNGALRILWAHNITIDGIAVDAVGRAPFNNPNVWGDGTTCNGQLYPLFHGNAGIALYISGAVTIRRCDISNGYFGIAVKDRNQGGAFANFNPADLEKQNIVPLSGFGRVGNHVFEKNRIHHNTWGLFFESAWDLGSTVRYNLLYENHHESAATAAAVKALSSEGNNQPSGAFLFKDVMLTPMAIYNNTFWHNYTLFSGGYRPGAQHLIFNNIYATPNQYLNSNLEFGSSFMEMSPHFVNRMHNCLFAAQVQPPKLDSQKVNFQEFDQGANKSVVLDSTIKFYRSVRIMNQMGDVAQENIVATAVLQLSTGPVTKTQPITGINLPGGLIGSGTNPFPAAANVRWYEINFKSTDPASPDFLAPNWEDSIVKKYVMNAGWPAAGIYNSDGQVADLGAVPSVARHTADVLIRPLSPALLNNGSAILSFDLQSVSGELTGAKVKYIRLVRSLPVLLTGFGGVPALVVPDPATVTFTDGSLKMGSNSLTVSGLPARLDTVTYAFFEIIAEGTAPNGKPATTNVGFIPYRKLDYKFAVTVLDAATGNPATSVKVGENAGLKIIPQAANGTLFNNAVTPVEVHLTSGSDILSSVNPDTKLAIDKVEGTTSKIIIFTKIPAGGGLEYVVVTGIWKSGANTLAFYGISQGVKILPGDPEKVIFQDPPSNSVGGSPAVIDPGVLYPVKVQVRDKFDNPSGAGVTVTIKSNNPDIGDIDGSATATTDSLGNATFKAKVTGGDMNQIFVLEASIPNKPSDKATLKVGKPRDRLWILYGDAAKYDANAELRGTAGERLKVTIRAGQDPDTKLADRQTEFDITGTPGLAFYANLTDGNQTQHFKLTNGEAVIYVTGLQAVDGGSIFADPPATENTILRAERSKIYFTFNPSAVQSASFHADNGSASVDRVEITFKADLKRAPDSIGLAWPAPGANAKVVKAGIAWEAASPRRVTVKLAEPFPAGLSSGMGAGTAYVYDPTTPGIPVQAMAFTGADSVGPLLDSGTVLEKISAGGDTLYIGFNEKIDGTRLVGSSLILIKPGAGQIPLTVESATEIAGKGWRITLPDMNAQSPAAGDSLKINGAGPVTDAPGNHAHAQNRPIALKLKFKPRPAFLRAALDKAFQKTKIEPQAPDFVILSSDAGSTWTPVQGSVGGTPAQDCQRLACGGPITAAPDGNIGRPAFTVETDRGMKFSVAIFNTLGEFVNAFSGEITNAQLGLDDRNLPVTGATPLFSRNASGRFAVKVAWNAKSKAGSPAATGAYIAKIAAVSKVENEDGKASLMEDSHKIKFGMVRD